MSPEVPPGGADLAASAPDDQVAEPLAVIPLPPAEVLGAPREGRASCSTFLAARAPCTSVIEMAYASLRENLLWEWGSVRWRSLPS